MKKVLVFCILALLLILSGCAQKSSVVSLRPSVTPGVIPTTPSPAAEPPSSPAASASPIITPAQTDASAPTTPSSPTPTVSPAAQPPTLQRVMEGLGKDLYTLSYDQLILVLADGSSCRLYTYEKDNEGIWTKVLGTSGHVGQNGVSSSKREGDKKTPAGIYRLGFAFGHDDNPNPDYPFRAISQGCYWVDDPNSRYYNQWVEGDVERNWESAEDLNRIVTEYALAVVVEYNYGADAVPGKGSAIFLHVGDEATSGCIAIPKDDLVRILTWLDEDASPRIVIARDE